MLRISFVFFSQLPSEFLVTYPFLGCHVPDAMKSAPIDPGVFQPIGLKTGLRGKGGVKKTHTPLATADGVNKWLTLTVSKGCPTKSPVTPAFLRGGKAQFCRISSIVVTLIKLDWRSSLLLASCEAYHQTIPLRSARDKGAHLQCHHSYFFPLSFFCLVFSRRESTALTECHPFRSTAVDQRDPYTCADAV